MRKRQNGGRLSRRAFLYLTGGGGALLTAGGLSGCGSGGRDPRTEDALATLEIAWPARTRHLPNYAESITVLIRQNSMVPLTRNRTRDDAYTESLPLLRSNKSGQFMIEAKAHAGPDGTGEIVAEATTYLTIFSGRTETLSLATILTSHIARIRTPGFPAVLTQGETVSLAIEARDRGDRLILLPPGVLTWSLAPESSAATLTPEGQLTPTAPGRLRALVQESGRGPLYAMEASGVSDRGT
jgi:hypothetical protein